MRLSLNALASSCLQVAGWSVLLLVAGLFLQTVVPDAMAQGSTCPLVDGVYVCNSNCLRSEVVNGACPYSCNNNPGTSCDTCGCGPVFGTTKCGCN